MFIKQMTETNRSMDNNFYNESHCLCLYNYFIFYTLNVERKTFGMIKLI